MGISRAVGMALTGQLTICQLNHRMENGADCLGSPDPVQRVRGQFIPALFCFPRTALGRAPRPQRSNRAYPNRLGGVIAL